MPPVYVEQSSDSEVDDTRASYSLLHRPPELARLIYPDDLDSSSARNKAIQAIQ